MLVGLGGIQSVVRCGRREGGRMRGVLIWSYLDDHHEFAKSYNCRYVVSLHRLHFLSVLKDDQKDTWNEVKTARNGACRHASTAACRASPMPSENSEQRILEA